MDKNFVQARLASIGEALGELSIFLIQQAKFVSIGKFSFAQWNLTENKEKNKRSSYYYKPQKHCRYIVWAQVDNA